MKLAFQVRVRRNDDRLRRQILKQRIPLGQIVRAPVRRGAREHRRPGNCDRTFQPLVLRGIHHPAAIDDGRAGRNTDGSSGVERRIGDEGRREAAKSKGIALRLEVRLDRSGIERTGGKQEVEHAVAIVAPRTTSADVERVAPNAVPTAGVVTIWRAPHPGHSALTARKLIHGVSDCALRGRSSPAGRGWPSRSATTRPRDFVPNPRLHEPQALATTRPREFGTTRSCPTRFAAQCAGGGGAGMGRSVLKQSTITFQAPPCFCHTVTYLP